MGPQFKRQRQGERQLILAPDGTPVLEYELGPWARCRGYRVRDFVVWALNQQGERLDELHRGQRGIVRAMVYYLNGEPMLGNEDRTSPGEADPLWACLDDLCTQWGTATTQRLDPALRERIRQGVEAMFAEYGRRLWIPDIVQTLAEQLHVRQRTIRQGLVELQPEQDWYYEAASEPVLIVDQHTLLRHYIKIGGSWRCGIVQAPQPEHRPGG